MDMRIAPLTAVSAAVAARQSSRFDEVVKAAYEAGWSREDLLLAVDSARLLALLPGPLLARAYASIHRWYWLESRRLLHGRYSSSVAA